MQKIAVEQNDEEDAEEESEDMDQKLKLLKVPFNMEKHFQSLMTQTHLASVELEMIMNQGDEKQVISKEKLEGIIAEQLANDELFEFHSRNIDEMERISKCSCEHE